MQNAHRLEVFAEGLGRAQLALDTTLVSAWHSDGSTRPGAANVDGFELIAAFPGPRSRAQFVVLAVEVGGALFGGNRDFSQYAHICIRQFGHTPHETSSRARMPATVGCMLACAGARAFAASLLAHRPLVGADDDAKDSAFFLLNARSVTLTVRTVRAIMSFGDESHSHKYSFFFSWKFE